jgi:hypothetical protein
LTTISNYNDTYLNDFNASFLYSNFVTTIDNTDKSIINNDTVVVPYYLLTLDTGVATNFAFSFGAEILITTPSEQSHSITADRGVFSSSFVVDGLNCQLEDDGIGNIRIVRVTSTSHIERSKVGTIDYSTGSIVISNLNVESYSGSGIKLYTKLVSQDYTSSFRNILKIKPEDINVTMVPRKS